MKVLIIDDSDSVAQAVYWGLINAGIEGWVFQPQSGLYKDSKKSPISAIQEADIIFIDHEMPGEKGDQLLERLKRMTDFSRKIVIGISSKPQPYVSERIGVNQIVPKIRELSGT